jgi:hypothetical protein
LGLKWISGKGLLKEFTAPNGTVRTFCSECGSSLGFRVKGESLKEIELAISTFDSDIPVIIDAHIFTDDKAIGVIYKTIYRNLNKGASTLKIA